MQRGSCSAKTFIPALRRYKVGFQEYASLTGTIRANAIALKFAGIKKSFQHQMFEGHTSGEHLVHFEEVLLLKLYKRLGGVKREREREKLFS